MLQDPLYRTSHYRLWLGGRPVAGFDDIKAPTRDKYDVITLERGVTHDLAFALWARGNGGRRNLAIELLNAAGQPVVRYKFYNSWVAHYPAMPNLDANANAIAIQHIKLENEGWERDTQLPGSALFIGFYWPILRKK